MTRLETLKKELEIINNLQCLAFNIKEEAKKYYEKEIECIEMYNSPNPEYSERKFYNIEFRGN